MKGTGTGSETRASAGPTKMRKGLLSLQRTGELREQKPREQQI